jgi:hypothetical protein
VGLNQLKQRFPRHHLLHLAQKPLAPCALLGRGLLVIAKSELLAAHELSPRLRLHREFSRGWLGFSRVSIVMFDFGVEVGYRRLKQMPKPAI